MSTDYHHGHLRAAVLDRAVEVITVAGPSGFSLRSLAADLGVSHTAPRHHFGSRQGVLTAVATQGYRLLGDRLRESAGDGGGLLAAGVAYVDFARTHPAHFDVMFSPTLLDLDDPELTAARATAFGALQGGVAQQEGAGTAGAGAPDPELATSTLAAWAIVHGIATLALTGNLEASGLQAATGADDLLDLTRRTAALLYRGGPAPGSDSRSDAGSDPHSDAGSSTNTAPDRANGADA